MLFFRAKIETVKHVGIDMGKPFSDLEKSALSILRSGGDPKASSDEAVKNYWDWRMNPSSNAHDLPATSTRTAGRGLKKVFILPFGQNLPTSTFITASISARSLTPANAQKAVLGFKDTTAADFTFAPKKFKPARVYWRTGGGESGVARPPSRITKRVYKSIFSAGDEGYSSPFGRVNTADNAAERQKAVYEVFKSNKLVTFTPEKFPL